jgi:carbon-monoxide dehydrogenase medium subunit
VYAGGTDLVVAIRAGAPWVAGVRHLVDVKSLDALRGISFTRGRLRIGSLVTAAELAASAVVRRQAPVLAESAANTAAPWVRARGTIAGNLMTPHAAGDLTTALVAMGGVAEFVTPAGRRVTVTVEALMSGRRRLARGALMLAVVAAPARTSAYEKLGRRQAFCRATLAVAVVEQSTGIRVAIAGPRERPALLTPDAALLDDTRTLVEGLVRRARGRMRKRGPAPRGTT